jgi:hypothetical protein
MIYTILDEYIEINTGLKCQSVQLSVFFLKQWTSICLHIYELHGTQVCWLDRTSGRRCPGQAWVISPYAKFCLPSWFSTMISIKVHRPLVLQPPSLNPLCKINNYRICMELFKYLFQCRPRGTCMYGYSLIISPPGWSCNKATYVSSAQWDLIETMRDLWYLVTCFSGSFCNRNRVSRYLTGKDNYRSMETQGRSCTRWLKRRTR